MEQARHRATAHQRTANRPERALTNHLRVFDPATQIEIPLRHLSHYSIAVP